MGSDGEQVVRLEAGEDGARLVAVDIAGRRVNFQLDTGAARTEIDTELARELGLEPVVTGANVVGFFGSEPARQVVLAKIRIGRVSIIGLPVFVRDSFAAEDSTSGIDRPRGLLGVDVLRAGHAVLDLVENTLRFRSERADHAEVAALLGKPTDFSYPHDQVPVVDVEIEGVRARFVVDTGASGNLVKASSPVADVLQSLPRIASHGFASGRTVPGYAVLVEMLEFGGVKLCDEPVFVYAPNDVPGSIGNTELYAEVDGTLGLPALVAAGARLDFGSGALWATRREEHAQEQGAIQGDR